MTVLHAVVTVFTSQTAACIKSRRANAAVVEPSKAKERAEHPNSNCARVIGSVLTPTRPGSKPGQFARLLGRSRLMDAYDSEAQIRGAGVVVAGL